MDDQALHRLAATIAARRAAAADQSYTRQLLDGGAERCARKLGEEAVETIIAALAEDDEKLAGEVADLFYHVLVLLECRKVPLDRVLTKLETRAGTSGLAEKTARKT